MEGWLEQGAGDKGKMLFGTQRVAMGSVTEQGVLQVTFEPCSFSQGPSFNLCF